MEFPEDLKYTKEHEWIRVEGTDATIGISDYAQESLGDVVFLELPEVGNEFGAGEAFGVVESVKAVSDLYSPLSGKIAEVNNDIVDTPEVMNSEPYGVGWLIKLTMSDPSELKNLMDVKAYESYVKEIA